MLKITKTKNKLKLKNKQENKQLKKIKHPYSLKNNKTKATLEYSTLKPLTNSLSPSAKSNGARFNSANNINKKKINKKINLKLKKESKFNLLIKFKIQNK